MSKILFISDLHLRHDTPQGRTDNFGETMFNKLKYVLDTALFHNVSAILQAGDFFHKPEPPMYLLNELIGLLQAFDIPIMSICGQHDLYMRNKNTDKSAFGLLDRVQLLQDVGRTKPLKVDNCYIYGCQFGEQMEDWGAKKSEFNILIIHDMIGNKPLYPGHELTDAGKFLENYPEYQIILCGDYHYPFHIVREGRHIINTGCLLRMSRDERDMNRTPFFYILDTAGIEEGYYKLTKYNVPCESAENVFSKVSEKQEKDSMMSEGELLRFIQQLKQRNKSGINFMSVLDDYFKENDTSEEVRNQIAEVLSNE